MSENTTRKSRTDLRNVAIVAHVDHGKTTLVDAMLWQGGAFGEHQHVDERAMDSGDLEREKGITILAKNTAIRYTGEAAKDGAMTINIIDTPGHADFGGEVERGLSMVDGIVLLVDASEGPLPQTRFVLRKALNADMPVVLVVNKVDRSDARISEVVDETYELFMDLLDDSHSADALDFPVVYASAKAGRASLEMPANGGLPDSDNLEPLFQTIIDTIPAPVYHEDAPLQAHVTNLDSSPFLGRLALVRVKEGTLKKGQQVAWMKRDGSVQNVKITELLVTEALERKPGESAGPGDIVAIAGIPEIMIGETLADPDKPEALPLITVDEPAISMTIGTNTSPLAGRVKGSKVTARLVKDRLDSELVGNVSINVLPTERPDAWEVQGRGELALAILRIQANNCQRLQRLIGARSCDEIALLKSRGVDIQKEIKTEPWGDRTFEVKDPDGYTFAFAKVIDAKSPYTGGHSDRVALFMPMCPVLVIAFFAALGLPGLSGWWSESFVFIGAFRTEEIRLWTILSLSGVVLGAAYMLWLLQRAFLGTLKTREWEHHLPDMTKREWLMLAPLAVIVIFLGVWPSPVLIRSARSAAFA